MEINKIILVCLSLIMKPNMLAVMELFSHLPLEKLIDIFSNKTYRHIELRKEIIEGDMADVSIEEYYILEDELRVLRSEIYDRYKRKYATE